MNLIQAHYRGSAWRQGLIDGNQLAKLAEGLTKFGYGQYLQSLVENT